MKIQAEHDPALGGRPSDDEVDMFGLTHPGLVRTENQDHFLLATVHPEIVVHGTSLPSDAEFPRRGGRLGTVMLVADGVGGSSDGGAAARLATQSVARYVASTLRCYHAIGRGRDEDFQSALREAAFQAHDAVRAEAAAGRGRMRLATTLTLGVGVWPWMYVVQVGDSRAYIYTGGKLQQVTRDQTMAQALVDEGALSQDAARKSPLNNMLSSAIGASEASPVVSRIDVSERGCVLVFCTDGLTKHVSDDEIARFCSQPLSAEVLARKLVDLALARGGSDNVTVVVAKAPLQALGGIRM